jgi:hypothetical protein
MDRRAGGVVELVGFLRRLRAAILNPAMPREDLVVMVQAGRSAEDSI